jgi:hypothetical protein
LEARTWVLASIDWRASTSACNANAGSVWAASRSPAVADSLPSWARGIPDSRRAVPMRVPLPFWARFVPGVFPDPNPMRVPIKALRWVLFSSTLRRVPRCGRGRLLGTGVREAWLDCTACSGSCIGIGTSIGTRSCPCVGKEDPIRVSVSAFKFIREAYCLPCVPVLPRFLLLSFL